MADQILSISLWFNRYEKGETSYYKETVEKQKPWRPIYKKF